MGEGIEVISFDFFFLGLTAAHYIAKAGNIWKVIHCVTFFLRILFFYIWKVLTGDSGILGYGAIGYLLLEVGKYCLCNSFLFLFFTV